MSCYICFSEEGGLDTFQCVNEHPNVAACATCMAELRKNNKATCPICRTALPAAVPGDIHVRYQEALAIADMDASKVHPKIYAAAQRVKDAVRGLNFSHGGITALKDTVMAYITACANVAERSKVVEQLRIENDQYQHGVDMSLRSYPFEQLPPIPDDVMHDLQNGLTELTHKILLYKKREIQLEMLYDVSEELQCTKRKLFHLRPSNPELAEYIDFRRKNITDWVTDHRHKSEEQLKMNAALQAQIISDLKKLMAVRSE